MKKLIVLLAAAIVLAGCERIPEPKETYTVGTVVQEYQDPSKWGCVGTDWNTVVRFDDNRVTKLCGRWGGVGGKVGGCWITGSYDRDNDGFRLICHGKEEGH